MIFTSKRLYFQFNLKLYGKELERGDCIKYLGIDFDKRLTWKVGTRNLKRF